MLPRRSQTELRFRLYLAVRKHDRNDLHFVLPDHALHVDGNAADTGIAARLLGSAAEDRFNFGDRHASFDFGVVVLRDGVATAANEEKRAGQQQDVFQWVHVGNPWECERNELLSGDVVPFAVSEMDTTEVVDEATSPRESGLVASSTTIALVNDVGLLSELTPAKRRLEVRDRRLSVSNETAKIWQDFWKV